MYESSFIRPINVWGGIRTEHMYINLQIKKHVITSLDELQYYLSIVRASVIRGFQWPNFSSRLAQRYQRMVLKFGKLTACIYSNPIEST